MEKVVPAAFKEMKNKKKNRNKGTVTPYVLFAKNHEKLRKEGEKWMINTANYSMLVATVIRSIMFNGQIADGLNQYPKLYKLFSVSSAIALFSSSPWWLHFLFPFGWRIIIRRKCHRSLSSLAYLLVSQSYTCCWSGAYFLMYSDLLSFDARHVNVDLKTRRYPNLQIWQIVHPKNLWICRESELWIQQPLA